MAEQWVITVVAEGESNPFDITSDFLTDLRTRGDYDIVASAITPASGIGATPVASSSSDTYDRDLDNHYIPTYGELLDGYDPSVYAGISVGKHVR